MGYRSKGAVAKGLSDYKKAPSMARALTSSGWVPQFRVFNELRQEEEEFTATEAEGTAAEEESAWARRLPPGHPQRQGRRRDPAL